MTDALALTLCARAEPLTPVGVFGRGAVGRALARRLLARGDVHDFSGLTSGDLLVVLGPSPPWADGAVFIGRDPDAPGLHVPTWARTTHHPAIVVQALSASGLSGPVALIPADGSISGLRRGALVPLGPAGPIDRARLERFAGGAE